MELWFNGQYFTAKLVFILIVLIIVFDFLRKLKVWKVYKFMGSMPGPMDLPIIGASYMLLNLNHNNVLKFVKNLQKKYPGYSAYWFNARPYLLVDDRQMINAILGSNLAVNKTEDYDYFKVHCEGIFTANGNVWRSVRKIITPSFQTKLLASFGDIFQSNMDIFLEKFELYANRGIAFDVYEPIHLCTIDFICETMMGCQINAQKNNRISLSKNLEKSTDLIFERSFTFLLWPDFVYKFSGKKKESETAVFEMRSVCREMAERRLKLRNELKSTEREPDRDSSIFLDSLLKRYESGEISMDQIAEEAVDMFIAGSVTTATTNAWIFLILAMYPEIQEKVQREIMEVCGERDVTIEDTSKLFYLDMVVKETLRHFTVPIILRKITTDFKVDEKITIPAGVKVVIESVLLHHNPEYWEKPKEFYPEHFLPEKVAARPKGAFLPFSYGPRICSGNKYAMMSIKFFVATTVRLYEFTTEMEPPKDFMDQQFRFMFMLWPTAGFIVKTGKRKSKLHGILAG